jgi:hypothetical protein
MACRNNSESEIDSAQVPSGTTTDDSFLVRTEPSNEFPFGRYRPFKKNCGMATTSTTTTQPDSFNTLQSLSKVNTQTQTGHSDLVVLLGDHCWSLGETLYQHNDDNFLNCWHGEDISNSWCRRWTSARSGLRWHDGMMALFDKKKWLVGVGGQLGFGEKAKMNSGSNALDYKMKQ